MSDDTLLQERIDKYYSKPNILIHAKYESSLAEEQILAWALAHTDDFVESKGSLAYSFPANTLKKLLGKSKSHSYNERLQVVARSMVGHLLGIEDPERGYFDYYSIVTRAHYEEGIFTIYFNNQLPLTRLKLHGNFTPLSLTNILSLKSKYSVRLYETLKSRCFHPKGSNRPKGYYEFEISLAELKFLLGVVNAELPEVKKILSKSSYPDYEKAFASATVRKYDVWQDFKRNVLDVAVEEINSKYETGHMMVEYEPIRGGRGAKIISLLFKIHTSENINEYVAEQENKEEMPAMSQKEKDSITAQILIKLAQAGTLITIEEATAISKACNYDISRLNTSIWIMQSYNGKIDDPVAFIIASMKKKYIASAQQVKKLKKSGIITIGNYELSDDEPEDNIDATYEEIVDYEQEEIPLNFDFIDDSFYPEDKK